MSKDEIKHEGRISSINQNTITVTIITKSACASCKTKSLCSSFEMKDKQIQVKNFGNQQWVIDEIVNVTMKRSMGNKAVFLGYLLPLFFLIITMVIATNITSNEAIIGISSIAAVGIYFYLLWLCSNKLKNTFTFKIEKYTNYDDLCSE